MPAGADQAAQTIAHVERLLLSRFAPASLVVDERGTIIYIHGRTGAYLEPSEGQPRHNILEMARHGLARPLAAAMRQAAAEKARGRSRGRPREDQRRVHPRQPFGDADRRAPSRSAGCCW